MPADVCGPGKTMPKIRVLVNGAYGRMGSLACQAIEQDPKLVLVGRLGRADKLSDLIRASQADVVVDLTHANSALANALAIISAGASPVIGTTGLTAQDVQQIQSACNTLKRGGVIAPNFALGAILMMQCAKEIASYFPHAEIIEYHHDQKKDAPSGTAIKTANMVAQAQSMQQAPAPEKETISGTRGGMSQGIAMHAVRLPGATAKQDVLFGAPGETLQITHHTTDRQAYMPGICLACKQVMSLQTCVDGLEHLIA